MDAEQFTAWLHYRGPGKCICIQHIYQIAPNNFAVQFALTYSVICKILTKYLFLNSPYDLHWWNFALGTNHAIVSLAKYFYCITYDAFFPKYNGYWVTLLSDCDVGDGREFNRVTFYLYSCQCVHTITKPIYMYIAISRTNISFV